MKAHSTTLRVIAPLIVVLVANCLTSAQPRRIEAIRKLSQEINQRIAESLESPDSSTTFLMELAVNKNLSPYPAVGIYKTVVSLYYTFGDREKNPYPDRLLKIVVATDRSDRKEYAEFLFAESGQLVFYFEKKDDRERRIYFAGEKPISMLEGDRPQNVQTKNQREFVATVLKQRAQLAATFRRSLDF